NTLGPLHYLFYARDNSSNQNVTKVNHVKVWDDDSPILNFDFSLTVATTGDPYEFLMNVTDNINLSVVRVIYWFGTGTEQNVSMDRGPNDQWNLTINIPSDSIDTLHYILYAIDNSSNFGLSETRDVIVTDNDLPALGADKTPVNATTGEPFTIIFETWDNIGIEEVVVNYKYGEGLTTDLILSHGEGDLWEGIITIDHILEDISYLVIVHDTSGNVNATSSRTIDVIDNDLPEIVEDLTPPTATTGDPLNITVIVQDNIGVSSVTLVHSFGGGDETSILMNRTGGEADRFMATIGFPLDALDSLSYHFLVEDFAGNIFDGPQKEAPVIDNDLPEIHRELLAPPPVWGLPITFEVAATDNIGVTSLSFLYRWGDGEMTEEILEPTASSVELAIPRYPAGSLTYWFKANDAADNMMVTPEYTLTAINRAPVVDHLPTWNVIESTDAEFDLTSYVSDINDDTFTVECDDDNITVEGQVLKLRHDTVVPDRIVILTVSDGEAYIDTSITIHVVNVNDLPVIEDVSTVDGSKFKVDEKVTFSINVTDEDLDELTVTWKDGDTVLGTGETIVYQKLKPGKHTITVTVFDGEAT
ncbi:MAG: PKD domain-containing protein, partial [Thermoplasmata archaeon]|nr:PKD domain-containing protein [Thermoplasmata archaeon]